MNHDDCRRQIVDDDLDVLARRHLDRCVDCRRFAEVNATVLRLAPTLVPAAPGDLGDRVLGRIGGHGSAAVSTLAPVRQLPPQEDSRRERRERMWRAMMPSLAAAVVALLVLGGFAVIADRASQSPEQVLLAAAERTVAEGSARVELDAEAEVVVPVPGAADPRTRPSAPDFATVAPELRAQAELQWELGLADFERALVEFEAEMDAFQSELDGLLQEMEQQVDEQMRQLGESFGGSPGRPRQPGPPPRPTRPGSPAPPAPERPAPEPPHPPTSVSAGFTVHGEGVLGFDGDELQLDGAVDGRGDREGFALVVRDDVALYRQPDATWMQLPGPVGPLGGVLLDPAAVERILTAPQGQVRHDGAVEVDGEHMDRYRFRVRDDALADGGTAGMAGELHADAWIDDSGRVRRLSLDADGLVDADSGVRWRSRMDLRLSQFGTASVADALPRPAATVELPGRSSQLVYPFGDAVRATAGEQ